MANPTPNDKTQQEQLRDADLGGDYARDTHRGGLGDDYAREGGLDRSAEPKRGHDHELGKGSE